MIDMIPSCMMMGSIIIIIIHHSSYIIHHSSFITNKQNTTSSHKRKKKKKKKKQVTLSKFNFDLHSKEMLMSVLLPLSLLCLSHAKNMYPVPIPSGGRYSSLCSYNCVLHISYMRTLSLYNIHHWIF